MYYCNFKVGYTMRDIRYFWRDGLSSVGMSSEVELPQFRVLGHRQRATEINLTTGTLLNTRAMEIDFFISIFHFHLHLNINIVLYIKKNKINAHIIIYINTLYLSTLSQTILYTLNIANIYLHTLFS